MAARGEGPQQRAVGGGVAVAPGRGEAEAETTTRAFMRRSSRASARGLPRSSASTSRAAVRVGVLGQDAPRAPPRRSRAARSRRRAPRGARPRPAPSRATRTSSPGSRKSSMPSQASVIRQAPAPAASKTRVAGEKPIVGHAVAGDVQHRERRAVEGVVVARVDVADVAHVRRHRLVVPAVAAEQEAPLGQARGRLEEELLDPRLAVGQAVAEEARSAAKRGSGGDRVVGRRVERVVDRHAAPRAEAPRRRRPPAAPPP